MKNVGLTQRKITTGGFLVGLLMAEVNAGNAKKLMGFLGDRQTLA